MDRYNTNENLMNDSPFLLLLDAGDEFFIFPSPTTFLSLASSHPLGEKNMVGKKTHSAQNINDVLKRVPLKQTKQIALWSDDEE